MEIWKDIQGYEGRYKISNLGRIKSLSKMNRKGNEFCSPVRSKQGYRRVVLFKDKKTKTYMVHRLVAQTFLSNPKNKPYINHKNGLKEDNVAENLEWVTSSENIEHAFKNKLCKSRKKVLQFNLKGKLIKEFEGLRVAERQIGINHCNISFCCNGIKKTAGGFIWKFKK